MYITKFPLNKFKELDTPFYYYDMELLSLTLEAIKHSCKNPQFKVHYAIKACFDKPVLKKIASYINGADTVSKGEIKAALEAGFSANEILFAGVGKTDNEINFALDAGIGCFNVESAEELEIIEQLAANKNMVAPVALRVNPDIDAHTHHYITTGLAENKFGIAMNRVVDLALKCNKSDSLKFEGLHFHIGSQITDFTPYKILSQRVNGLTNEIENLGIPVNNINLGGGLGIDYENPDINPIPDFKFFFNTINDELKVKPHQTVHFELGRSIVAQCGSLISRVTYIKKGQHKEFAIIDAGMTDLIRPALYQAHHLIQNLSNPFGTDKEYDVVGPICESSDVFAEQTTLPECKRGDILAIRSAGAYGRAMASGYNCRPITPAVYSNQEPEEARQD